MPTACPSPVRRRRQLERAWQRFRSAAQRLGKDVRRETDERMGSYGNGKGGGKGKAGGYGIQGLASSFIPWIGGSYTGIVGLPLTETLGLLSAFGYPVFGKNNG